MAVLGLPANLRVRDTRPMHSSAEEHNSRILDQFTRQAEPFALAPAHSAEESLRLLLGTVAVTPADAALDVACGPGIVACALAAIARHVTGIDLVPAMLDQACKLQTQKGLRNVNWQLGDAACLPFGDESFSLVVTRYSFHHLLDPVGALTEMARVCRPGGRIAVADVTPEAEKAQAYDELETLRDPSHTRALSQRELQALGTAPQLKLLNTAFYRLDTALETLLADSFPPPGNADRIRQLVRDDIGVNRLSIQAYLRGEEVRFSFPVSIVVWEKPSSVQSQ